MIAAWENSSLRVSAHENAPTTHYFPKKSSSAFNTEQPKVGVGSGTSKIASCVGWSPPEPT